MLQAYVSRDALLERVVPTGEQALPQNTVWIDLFEPSPEERTRVEQDLGIALPSREEMREIEPSSRLYVEAHASYMTATILNRADDPNPSADPFTFVLAGRTLITLRYVDPRPVNSFAQRAQRHPGTCNGPEEALIGLLEAFVDRIADILEKVGLELDQTSRMIFDTHPSGARGERDLQAVLKRLGRNDDLSSTARESLMSLSRVVRFLGTIIDGAPRRDVKPKEQKTRLKTLDRDITSLAEHASFESNKVNFLLNATLGMINIEQNRIIKLFSVAAVVFLPPTLVASMYGMNFKHMPELDWLLGYPMAIALMVLSAIVPYLWFKRKGWF